MCKPDLLELASEIHACTRCPRLRDFLRDCRRKHPDYWARPVSGFGDPGASLLILGLAPGYHGANRYGRVFTGDDSGRWLWGALHELGVCSEPDSTDRDQPLVLKGIWMSNAERCAPPGNRPTTAELDNCRPFLQRELELLPNVRAVLALGRLAHETYLKLLRLPLSRYPFRHGAVHEVGEEPLLIDSYHPSRQNTNTGVLTWSMWICTIRAALQLARLQSTER